MPFKRVFSHLRRGKDETHPKLDAVLKNELDDAIVNLRRFTDQLRRDTTFIENLEAHHQIPEEMKKED